MLVPFLQARHVLLVLRLVFFNQLLQEDLQVGLVLGKRETQRSEERVSVGLYFGQGLVFEFAADGETGPLNLLPPAVPVLQEQFLELLVVISRPFAAIDQRRRDRLHCRLARSRSSLLLLARHHSLLDRRRLADVVHF